VFNFILKYFTIENEEIRLLGYMSPENFERLTYEGDFNAV